MNLTKLAIVTLGLLMMVGCQQEKQVWIKASLDDDLSATRLELFNDGTYKFTSQSILSLDEFEGDYLIDDDTIRFNNDKDNTEVPEQVFRHGDKLVLYLNEEGSPDTSFANFYQIQEEFLD